MRQETVTVLRWCVRTKLECIQSNLMSEFLLHLRRCWNNLLKDKESTDLKINGARSLLLTHSAQAIRKSWRNKQVPRPAQWQQIYSAIVLQHKREKRNSKAVGDRQIWHNEIDNCGETHCNTSGCEVVYGRWDTTAGVSLLVAIAVSATATPTGAGAGANMDLTPAFLGAHLALVASLLLAMSPTAGTIMVSVRSN